MKLLIVFLLIASAASAQNMKMDVIIERVSVNHSFPTLPPDKERIVLIFENKNIGIITSQDTLALEYLKPSTNNYVYIEGGVDWIYQDLYHDNQLYRVVVVKAKDGMAMFVTPLKPYNRRLNSLNIRLLWANY
jgi:hypothetical protein